MVSVGQITQDYACTFEVSPFGFVIKDQEQQVLATRHEHGQLYALGL